MGTLPKTCWAPCFTINSGNLNLKVATKIIALYTAVLHLLVLFYAIGILRGGRSDTFFSPLFEFSRYGMNVISIFLIVYCALFIIAGSWWLTKALKNEIRFYYMPWLWASILEIVLMVAFGIFMVYRYYHYYWSTFAAIILWSYSAYHFYMWLIVLSQYYQLKRLQEPNIVFVYPY